jgi:hypothetical protein
MDLYRFPRVGTAALLAFVLAWSSNANAQLYAVQLPPMYEAAPLNSLWQRTQRHCLPYDGVSHHFRFPFS